MSNARINSFFFFVLAIYYTNYDLQMGHKTITCCSNVTLRSFDLVWVKRLLDMVDILIFWSTNLTFHNISSIIDQRIGIRQFWWLLSRENSEWNFLFQPLVLCEWSGSAKEIYARLGLPKFFYNIFPTIFRFFDEFMSFRALWWSTLSPRPAFELWGASKLKRFESSPAF